MLNAKDMTDLLYIHDACDKLNITLLGTELMVGYHEGVLGALSRIHGIIERNVPEELKKNDYESVWKIVEDTSLTMEQQAEMLVGNKDEDSKLTISEIGAGVRYKGE